ncbi:MAG TPA: TIGR01212 family radical SAM protein [Candidatus Dorea gallistercoris]|uniref:TIGR01212 family radical SAM protein n=1 Tax=Candidatus Dorea gallistercoris TaxID=2838542 RepID=A0A9D1UDD2_9FIRM|nr:TIGR01212 family radical SAM protein [Candidatus Dorea gallistercoris]
MAVRWGEKRYHSLDYHLKETYGEKLYKLSLNGGMTCPNRDGTVGTGGCIFCSQGGSGDFAAPSGLSISDQIQQAKGLVSRKYAGHSYIAYFQAYTNTYGPISYLRQIFTEAISPPEVRILAIATRPDCLSTEILELLRELNQVKPVWVELGLQTIHEETARFIRRGYSLSVFTQAVSELRAAGIEVIVHTILALPGETTAMMLDTLHYLNEMNIQGLKLQLLHILKGTDLADYYESHPFWIPSLEEYTELLGVCLSRIRPEIVIHRLTGDGPKPLLIAPSWSRDKRRVLNHIESYFRQKDLWQGKELF